MTYTYCNIDLTAKTDTGARRQVLQLIASGKAEAGFPINFFRASDGCKGWFPA